MFQALIRKMLGSRKFVVMAVAFLVKAIAPFATNHGIDLMAVSDALTEYMPVIITWLLGQSAVDTAKELYLPPPPADALGVPGQ